MYGLVVMDVIQSAEADMTITTTTITTITTLCQASRSYQANSYGRIADLQLSTYNPRGQSHQRSLSAPERAARRAKGEVLGVSSLGLERDGRRLSHLWRVKALVKGEEYTVARIYNAA